MSGDFKVSASSFSCCVCLEDNKCNAADDLQTYAAYVEWVKVHRTNYLSSPVALCVCAKHHMCSQERYETLRQQAIDKRGLDTYVIACPVSGCAETLMQIPNERGVWDFLVEVCPNGHLLDYNCYLRLKSFGTSACPMCRSDIDINRAHCIPTVPITPPDGMPAWRKLDGLGVFLDLILSEDEVSRAYMRHENFPSMIQDIFVNPQHKSCVRGMHARVARVFLLAQNTLNYEVLQQLVACFLEEWAFVTRVIDVLMPCKPDAFKQITTCLMEMILLITQQLPPNNTLRKSVLNELQVVLKFLTMANRFVEREWWLILTAQNDVIQQNVPEFLAFPDVANPSEQIAREPPRDSLLSLFLSQYT